MEKQRNTLNITPILKQPNIVLIGMRGSGKSVVGNLLAERVHKNFIDTDELIVQRSKESIPDMIKRRGWDYFRDQESVIAKKVSDKSGVVIATGGGIILRPTNVTALKSNGKLILLIAQPAVLAARIGNDPNRPALTNHPTLEAEIKALWNERRSTYMQAADILIETDKLSPEEIVEEILKKL